MGEEIEKTWRVKIMGMEVRRGSQLIMKMACMEVQGGSQCIL